MPGGMNRRLDLRVVDELDFVGALLNPDPSQGMNGTPPLGNPYWYPSLRTSLRARLAGPYPCRLMTILNIGPITATALAALAPPPEAVRTGRDFAAWLGLTPLQKSTDGKQQLGATSKMGNEPCDGS